MLDRDIVDAPGDKEEEDNAEEDPYYTPSNRLCKANRKHASRISNKDHGLLVLTGIKLSFLIGITTTRRHCMSSPWDG